MLSILRKSLPRPLKRQLRFSVELLLDGVDLVLRRRKEIVPPRRLNFFVGDGDFEKTGEEFLRYFVNLGGLKSSHRMLDVGCGIGRMARPLAGYLNTGGYEGIDIVPYAIRWCQRHIGRRHPNFRFHLADIQNDMYNRRGCLKAAQYRFPFDDGDFDFVGLTSVFTHMLRQDMEHYLREISRVLRPHGKCLITFFLVNDESRNHIDAGLSSFAFPWLRDGCWINDEGIPEAVVAYEEGDIKSLYADLGLAVETVQYGAWCGRGNYLSFQDIVVARKTQGSASIPGGHTKS